MTILHSTESQKNTMNVFAELNILISRVSDPRKRRALFHWFWASHQESIGELSLEKRVELQGILGKHLGEGYAHRINDIQNLATAYHAVSSFEEYKDICKKLEQDGFVSCGNDDNSEMLHSNRKMYEKHFGWYGYYDDPGEWAKTSLQETVARAIHHGDEIAIVHPAYNCETGTLMSPSSPEWLSSVFRRRRIH